MSFVRILVFAMALTHVVGLADMVMSDACEESCDDDGCDTDCPLPGVACRCHCPSGLPLLSSSPQRAITKLATPKVSPPVSADQRMHESPDPREIQHVPKRVV